MTNASLHPRWLPRFVAIWTGQSFSLLGSSLVQFALVWWLTAKTGSATVLATATLVAMLPQILVSPIAGAIVDRSNRRLIMIAADSGIALATLILAALFWTDAVQIWHVYALMMIRSFGGAFHMPAMMASTSLMVPEQHLARVSGANQTLQGLLGIVAPPLGALLLSTAPLQAVLLIDFVTAMLAVLPLLVIGVPQPLRAATAVDAPKSSLLDELRAGVRYMLDWPAMRIILVLGLVVNFVLLPGFSLLPLLVTRSFNGAAPEVALIEALSGAGMIVGGVLLGVWGGFKRRILTSMLGLALLGAGFIIVGLTPGSMFWLAVGAMALIGLSNPITNGPLMAILQSRVPADMQGRVMSLLTTASIAITPLSLLVAGPVADTLGIQTWYVVGGIGCLVMLAVGLLSPALMNIDNDSARDAGAPAAVTVEPNISTAR